MMTAVSEFATKTALITGASSGLGADFARQLAEMGCNLILVARRKERLDAVKEEIADTFPSIALDVIAMDLAVPGAAENLIGEIESWGRHVDILVNNAGIQIEKTVLETTDDDYEALMAVNARGVFLVCRACIPIMSRGGSIINIGSISASTADSGLALYNASKAFVQGLTRSIAVDHGPDVRCNAISPGWIMTGMADAAFAVADDPAAAKRDALTRHPAGRFGEPADIAGLATWLASDEASFATGQCYTLDGGMTAASPLNPGFF